MQLLLMEGQYVVKALSPDTPQKTFTDGIGSGRMIGCCEYLDAARCCHTSETEEDPIFLCACWSFHVTLEKNERHA
jgi:hypothetical protein